MAVVLLADDDARLRRGLRRLLVHEGHSVLEAASGLEALRAHDVHQLDLVILDLDMPEMDGAQVLERLRATAPSLPIVMFSGSCATTATRELLLHKGATSLCVKPDTEALVRAVRSFLPPLARDARGSVEMP